MTQLVRAVIDTNILVSALVFSSGKLKILRQLWQDDISIPKIKTFLIYLVYIDWWCGTI